MLIAWQYLDKKAATINALKDYDSMKYIIEHTDDEIYSIESHMDSPRSALINGMPKVKNPKSFEDNLISRIEEIDVLKERYRQALEYMEWFKPAWDELTKEERILLTEFFLSTSSKTEAVLNLSDKLFLERAQVYRRKDSALNHLALLLYGK